MRKLVVPIFTAIAVFLALASVGCSTPSRAESSRSRMQTANVAHVATLDREQAKALLESSDAFQRSEVDLILPPEKIFRGVPDFWLVDVNVNTSGTPFILTAKGQQYFQYVLYEAVVFKKDAPMRVRMANPPKRRVTEVTGIREDGSHRVVQYLWTYDFPPELRHLFPPQRGETALAKYDDGWRVDKPATDMLAGM